MYNIQLFNQYIYTIHLFSLSRSPLSSLSQSRSPLSSLSQSRLPYIQMHMYNIQLYKYIVYLSPTLCPLSLASLLHLNLSCHIYKCICIIYNYIHIYFTSLPLSVLSLSPLSSISRSRSPLSSISQSLLPYIQIHMYNIQLSNQYTYTIHLSPTLFPSLASPLSPNLARLSPPYNM